MEKTGFSDTGFFYAVADARDRWHPECTTVFENLKKQRGRLITTLLVVAEIHALVLQRMGQATALNLVKTILESVEIVPIEPSDIAKALEILEHYADKDFSQQMQSLSQSWNGLESKLPWLLTSILLNMVLISSLLR